MENEIYAHFCAPPPMYVMMSLSSVDPDLLEEFADILKECEVCDAIDEEDCRHFLNDEVGHNAEDDGVIDKWDFVENPAIESE